MQIKLLRTVHAGDLYLKKGTTSEVPDELAAQLIKAKSAEAVADKKEKGEK